MRPLPTTLSFTFRSVCISVLLSRFISPLLPHCARQSVLYTCVSVPPLQIGSSVPFFYILYVCISLHTCFSLSDLLFVTRSRFVHITRTDSDLFLFMADQYSIVCMCHSFFIHSSLNGHLRFRVLAVVNHAAVNIGVHVSFSVSDFLRM